ncbi:divalent-cation tolerance protein CutA [Microbaculum marinum]|uniref:Divalent-cation tolerance protein CutA n=1 Tax=Microbaculum marinum TaxID=1764581 RepID=A0AAW9RW49_9HYPH
MIDTDDPIRLIYSTFATIEDAERCGSALVTQKLAACVNILPRMISIYEWNAALSHEEEVVMIVKTRQAVLERALTALQDLHPYDTPALIVLDTVSVNPAYADWLRAQTRAS